MIYRVAQEIWRLRKNIQGAVKEYPESCERISKKVHKNIQETGENH